MLPMIAKHVTEIILRLDPVKINDFGSYSFPDPVECNRNMSKSKGWTLQSSLLMLWMEKTRVNNQTTIDDK